MLRTTLPYSRLGTRARIQEEAESMGLSDVRSRGLSGVGHQ